MAKINRNKRVIRMIKPKIDNSVLIGMKQYFETIKQNFQFFKKYEPCLEAKFVVPDKRLQKEEKEILGVMFNSLDRDGDGWVTVEELTAGLRDVGVKVAPRFVAETLDSSILNFESFTEFYLNYLQNLTIDGKARVGTFAPPPLQILKNLSPPSLPPSTRGACPALSLSDVATPHGSKSQTLTFASPHTSFSSSGTSWSINDISPPPKENFVFVFYPSISPPKNNHFISIFDRKDTSFPASLFEGNTFASTLSLLP